MRRLAVVAVALSLLLTSAVSAAKPIAFRVSQQAQMIDPVIESQTPNGHIMWPPDLYTIVNPTNGRCVWDVDDWTQAFGAGYIEPGQSVSYSQCLIISDGHLINTFFNPGGGNNNWRLTIAIPELGWSVSSLNSTRICMVGVNVHDMAALQAIPGSDNNDGVQFGYGKFATVVRTITNTGSKRINNALADYNLRIPTTLEQQAYYCPPGPGQAEFLQGGAFSVGSNNAVVK